MISHSDGVSAALEQLGLVKTALMDPGSHGTVFAGPRTLREAGQQAGVAGAMGAGFAGAANPAFRRGLVAFTDHMTGGLGGTNPMAASLHNLVRLEPLMDGSIAYRKARNEGAGRGPAIWSGVKAALPSAANLIIPGRVPSQMAQHSLLRQAHRDIKYWDEMKDVRNGGTGQKAVRTP